MKTKLVISTLVGLLFLSSCGKNSDQVHAIPFETTKVQSGSIEIGKNYTAEVKSYESTSLSSEAGGRIVFLGVNEGDTVKRGQILARIDTEEIQTDVTTSDMLTTNINTLIENTKASYDAQIEVLKSKKSQGEIGLLGIKQSQEDTGNIHTSSIENLKTQIDVARNRVLLAETNKIKTENQLDTEEKNIYANIKNTITASIILDTNIIDFVDGLIGYTEISKDKNNKIEDYFGAKNTVMEKKLEEDFVTIYKSYTKYKEQYDSIIVPEIYSRETLNNTVNIGLQFNESLRIFLGDLYTVTDNSIANVSLTQTQIDSYKADITKFGKDLESLIISVNSGTKFGLKGIMQNLESFYAEKERNLALLEKTVEIEKSGLQSMESTLAQSLDIQTSENSKLSTTVALTGEQIQEIDKSIVQVEKEKETKVTELLLEKAKIYGGTLKNQVMQKNATLYAPFDGIILGTYFKIGTTIMPGIPLFEIASEKDIYIEASLPREKLTGKTTGDIISFRTSDGITKTARIEQIYDYLDPINKNQKIEVVPFEKTQLFLNQTVKAFFSQDSATGSVIPNNAIVQRFAIPGVYTLSGNTIIFKNILIEEQNEYYSLVSGIVEGDTVVTVGKENIYDGYILP